MRLSVCGATATIALLVASSWPVAQGQRAHLSISNTQFTHADGKLFHWRGITAFRLLEMISRARVREVEAYLDWCSEQGLTVVRVLTMAEHLFALEPEDGRAALSRLLTMASRRGLHVEIVALADTAAIPVDIEQHVREVGAIAARHGNALVEIANEPAHPTQVQRVHAPSELERLAPLIPEDVPVALGSAEENGRFSGGDYATVHFSRHSDRGGWGHVMTLASGAELMKTWGKPLVNDEPIGAGEEADPGRRDDDPERFRAAALLSRMVGMGATFHYEGGLHARIPERRERACFDAWQEAWTLLPAQGTVTLARPGDQGSPVRSVTGDFSAAYVAVAGERAWLLVIGTRGGPAVTWAEDWRPGRRQAWSESLWWPATRAR